MSNKIDCPLLKKEIESEYCYEITMCAYGFFKMDSLDDNLDRETAAKMCESCKYNQSK